jgi:tetratricopeptide (TPR) repeat protein
VKSGPPTVAKTGKPQVDELIDVAAQSRELGDADGAMQALERADLMLPDNPIILREKALTFGKLGQVDKAQQLWDRIEKLGPGAGTESAPMTSAPPPPPPVNEGGLNGAFASLTDSAAPKGPIWLGDCQVSRDLTAAKGQKLVLKIPVIAKPGVSIGVDDWNLDVLFYDRVDEVRVEPTKADPVVYTSDTDPATGNMVISAVYHMPELSPQDVANIGHREYYGYIVKLYYQHRLMSTAASPRDLLNNPGGPGATAAPAGNPLLPLPRP